MHLLSRRFGWLGESGGANVSSQPRHRLAASADILCSLAPPLEQGSLDHVWSETERSRSMHLSGMAQMHCFGGKRVAAAPQSGALSERRPQS